MPRFVSSAALRVTTPGIYVFTGSSAVSWAVANGDPTSPRRIGASYWIVKNRGTAILTLTPATGNFYDDASSTSVQIAPGGGMIIFWDGTFQSMLRFPGRTTSDSSATPGNQTASTRVGRCSIAAAGTSVTVTNALCTVNSNVGAQVSTNDATAIIKNVVPGAGSFVVTLNAAATGTTNIDWEIKM